MTAFTQSGRSDYCFRFDARGCFRPKADAIAIAELENETPTEDSDEEIGLTGLFGQLERSSKTYSNRITWDIFGAGDIKGARIEHARSRRL
jgi:hypothetical protein